MCSDWKTIKREDSDQVYASSPGEHKGVCLNYGSSYTGVSNHGYMTGFIVAIHSDPWGTYKIRRQPRGLRFPARNTRYGPGVKLPWFQITMICLIILGVTEAVMKNRVRRTSFLILSVFIVSQRNADEYAIG